RLLSRFASNLNPHLTCCDRDRHVFILRISTYVETRTEYRSQKTCRSDYKGTLFVTDHLEKPLTAKFNLSRFSRLERSWKSDGALGIQINNGTIGQGNRSLFAALCRNSRVMDFVFNHPLQIDTERSRHDQHRSQGNTPERTTPFMDGLA